MKRPTTNLTDDELNRLLDAHLGGAPEDLQPSSGFVSSVMESIEAEAAEPRPIAFPWGRALPGLFALLCCLVVLGAAILRMSAGIAFVGTGAGPAEQLFSSLAHTMTAQTMTLSWLAVAALLSIAAIAASFRLTSRSG